MLLSLWKKVEWFAAVAGGSAGFMDLGIIAMGVKG